MGAAAAGGGFKDRLRTMTEREALEALAADGKLVKRPIVDLGSVVLVGFDEEAFARHLGDTPLDTQRPSGRGGL